MKFFATLLVTTLMVVPLSASNWSPSSKPALQSLLEVKASQEIISAAQAVINNTMPNHLESSASSARTDQFTLVYKKIIPTFDKLATLNNTVASNYAAYFKKLNRLLTLVTDIENLALDTAAESYADTKEELMTNATALAKEQRESLCSFLSGIKLTFAQNYDTEDAVGILCIDEAHLILNTWILLAKIAQEVANTPQQKIIVKNSSGRIFGAVIILAITARGVAHYTSTELCQDDTMWTQECASRCAEAFTDLVWGPK